MTLNFRTQIEWPLVSVIVPCFNQSRYAYEAVLSAKYAYSGPLQILVVNDGSSEIGAESRLRSVAETLADTRCKIDIISQENRGLPGARNAGIRLAEGEFVQLLDCDDLLTPGKIDRHVIHFAMTDNLSVSLTDCIYSNESLDKFERESQLLQDWVFDISDIASHWERGLSIPIHCALFRSDVFGDHLFNETQRAKEDWLFWTHLASEQHRIAFMGTPGAIYRIHDKSICRSMPEIGREWILASIEIDRIVRAKVPNFLDDAVSWYVKQYAGHAVHKEPTDSVNSEPDLYRARPFSRTYSAWAPPGDLPLVSIVIPVCEHFEYLEQCFNSALDQMDGRVEIILVDDASRDPRIRPCLEKFSQISGVKCDFHETNRGVSNTLNSGIALANGEYVAFLDCDDMLLPDSLAVATSHISYNQGCDYFFSDRYDITESGEILRLARYGGYSDDRFNGDLHHDLLNGMIASHLKIIRKSAIEQCGGLDDSLSGVQDWDLALKICGSGKVLYLPQPLYMYRVHPHTVTKSDRRPQFMRSNIVRRRFMPKFLSTDIDRTTCSPKTLLPSEIQPRTLANLWRDQPLVLDTSNGIQHGELWQLREFNSYFDEIICTSPEIFAALLGYVWSPEILKMAEPN